VPLIGCITDTPLRTTHRVRKTFGCEKRPALLIGPVDHIRDRDCVQLNDRAVPRAVPSGQHAIAACDAHSRQARLSFSIAAHGARPRFTRHLRKLILDVAEQEVEPLLQELAERPRSSGKPGTGPEAHPSSDGAADQKPPVLQLDPRAIGRDLKQSLTNRRQELLAVNADLVDDRERIAESSRR
jgi:hypothetical protein